MTESPTVSVLITGSRDATATRHTASSVRCSDYPGELHVLTGSIGETGSPAAIANAHAGETRGTFLMFLQPGSTLDPRCIRRLVARAVADDLVVAVAPQWRRPDGAVLEAGSYLSNDQEIRPVFEGEQPPPSLVRVPYAADLSAVGSMLIRAKRFLAVGGYNLELDGSPYQAADLSFRLTRPDGRIEVAPGAVGFLPSNSTTPDLTTGTGLRARNRFRSDWVDRIDQLDVIEPDEAPLRALINNQAARRVLWAASHVPDGDRSGIQARHLGMIRALVDEGADVVLWAEQGDDGESSGRQLESMGVRWVAPPPDQRWDLGSTGNRRKWLRDLLGALHWDTVIIAEPRLAPQVIPQVRALTPHTTAVVDLGSVRYPDAHDPAIDVDLDDPTLAQELAGSADADAVVATSRQDRGVVQRAAPDRPTFVFSALGEGAGVGTGPSGGGAPLFIGDLFHHPNVQALEWWMDAIAAQVEARLGYPVPLRVVGRGSEGYRSVWNHPGKITIAGWQPNLAVEMEQARMLVVPLTYATGTGGRIAGALARGVPVVASAPAAAVLPPRLAAAIRIGVDAAGLADHIWRLMTDDTEWEADRDRIGSVDIPSLRQLQAEQFGDWLASVEPAYSAPVVT